MRKVTFLIFTFLIYYVGYGQQMSGKEILLKSKQVLLSNNSFEYKSAYRIKFFDYKDTSKFERFDCTIQKAPLDTVLMYNAKMLDMNNGDERIYDGNYFFHISHQFKKLVTNNPFLTGKGYVKNNIKKEHIPSFFYTNNPFSGYLNNAISIRVVNNSKINKKNCWEIEITLPIDEEITMMKHYIAIDKATFLPVRVVSKAKFQNIQDEYWELVITNLKVSNRYQDFGSIYRIPSTYTNENVLKNEIDLSLLKSGSEAIEFKTKDIYGKPFNLGGVKDKRLLLLDFWYLACPPCIKSIPGLISLQERFGNKGLQIIGLNSFDTSNYKLKQVTEFSKAWKINYPLLTISKEVDLNYLIKVYPTIYLIENNKIIYSAYGDINKDEIEEIIRRILE